MSDLLDGAGVPWDFISGQTERTAPDVDPLVAQRVRERRQAAQLEQPLTPPSRVVRVVAAGRAIARDLRRTT